MDRFSTSFGGCSASAIALMLLIKSKLGKSAQSVERVERVEREICVVF